MSGEITADLRERLEAAATELGRAKESLREKNEIIKAYAGPTGMTPEDVAFALAGEKSLWTCGAGHVVYVDPDVPPYEMAPCPFCRADEERREWAEVIGATTVAEGMLAVGKELIRLRRVEAAAKDAAACRSPLGVGVAEDDWTFADCGRCTGCKLIAALAGGAAEGG